MLYKYRLFGKRDLLHAGRLTESASLRQRTVVLDVYSYRLYIRLGAAQR